MAPLPAWKKVLYLKQPYDDNYVDSSFLDSLKVNAHLQKYEFWALWHDALSIIFQLSLVVMFLNVWWRMQQSLWNLQGLLVLDGILFGGFILGWRREHTVEALLDVLQAAKIIFPLWVLAPLLQTLTRSWSDDTIAAIASILLVLHVASFRYKDSPVLSQGSASTAASPGAVRSLAGGPTALNAAMLAATILASRLLTAQEVFAFMSFAMEVFVLPRRRIAALFPVLTVFVLFFSSLCALVMTGFTVAETWQSSISATHWQDVYIYIQFFSTKAAAFVIVTAMIGLLSPALFLCVQRHKAQIQAIAWV
ncbi:unnamed protein product [Durusdinium trenchii]|uniref:Uncharacterized protein n=2 Tax=Durusdinium trenchii TaxID=1381693 RepID=A0ABP0I4I5_9DINO